MCSLIFSSISQTMLRKFSAPLMSWMGWVFQASVQQMRTKWAKLVSTVAHIYSQWRREKKPPVIPSKLRPKESDTGVKSTELREWEAGTYVIPVDGVKFADWELGMLKYKNPQSEVLREGEVEVAVKGYYDPFQAISSRFIDIPPIPPLGATSVPAPTTPAANASAPKVQPGPKQQVGHSGPFKRQDGLDGPRNYLAEVRLKVLDINKLQRSEKEGLKRGIPHNVPTTVGEEFYSARSKKELASIPSLLPTDTTTFSQVVHDLGAMFPDSSAEAIAWYLATKLLLMKSQVTVTANNGEIYIRANV